MKLLSGKTTEKVDKQNIQTFGIRNWLFDELNEIFDTKFLNLFQLFLKLLNGLTLFMTFYMFVWPTFGEISNVHTIP